MDLDLHTIRNLEKFFELNGLKMIDIGPQMQFQIYPVNLFLEIQQKRLLISSCYEERQELLGPMALFLLQKCSPKRTYGVVQHVLMLNNALMLSCAAPEMSQAELWYKLYNTQRNLLMVAAQSTT